MDEGEIRLKMTFAFYQVSSRTPKLGNKLYHTLQSK